GRCCPPRPTISKRRRCGPARWPCAATRASEKSRTGEATGRADTVTEAAGMQGRGQIGLLGPSPDLPRVGGQAFPERPHRESWRGPERGYPATAVTAPGRCAARPAFLTPAA